MHSFGENALIVSFSRMILRHAPGTILVYIYFFYYHVIFSLSFCPGNWSVIGAFDAMY